MKTFKITVMERKTGETMTITAGAKSQMEIRKKLFVGLYPYRKEIQVTITEIVTI
ncbi:MAG: hypothetical protein Q4Q06_05035 [Bacteroidota bacterium]|nr:hypothetical protein [Bacteroidota bacterium]